MRRCAAARVMRPARQARSCSRHAHTQLRVSGSARAEFVEPRHLPCASSHCGKCGARSGEFFAPRRSRRLRFADSTSVILRALAGGVQSPRTSTSSERAMCSFCMPAPFAVVPLLLFTRLVEFRQYLFRQSRLFRIRAYRFAVFSSAHTRYLAFSN